MVRIRTSSPRPAWSALSVLALLSTAWAAAAATGAMAAADNVAMVRDFGIQGVLAASRPYAMVLFPLLTALAVLGPRRGAWAREPQVVKLGIIVSILAGATAWVMVAYPALAWEFWAR